MPNTFPSYVLPAGADRLPDLAATRTGRPVTSDHWTRMAALIHHVWARASRARLSQSWQGSPTALVVETPLGAATRDVIQYWRCPLLSAAHTTLIAHVYCEHTAVAGGGAIEVRLVTTAAAGAWQPVPVGGAAWLSLTCALPVPPAATWVDVTLEVQSAGGAGDRAEFYDICMEIEPLASPLAVAPVVTAAGGEFVGLGSATLFGDFPLSSARLTSMVEDLDELYRLPRLLCGWAGVSDYVAGIYPSPEVIQAARPYEVWPRAQDGDTEFRDVTVYALCRRGAGPTDLVVRHGRDVLRIQVPAGPGVDVWVTGTLTVGSSPARVQGAVPPNYALRFDRRAGGVDESWGTAGVLSLSVWGV